MKNYLLLIAMCFCVSCTDKADVPETVTQNFEKAYPDVKKAEWETEGANYEASFKLAEVENSVVYDASGNIVETEVEISPDALPSAATNHVAQNLEGKKITEAARITSSSGKVTYEAEVENDDYIFDEAGNFISKEIEEEDNEEDEDANEKE